MSKQPEALRLADALEQGDTYDAGPHVVYGWVKSDPTDEAAAELRRLHSLNAELVEALDGALSLSIAWAGNYQAMHTLQEFHPVHAGIIDKARDAMSKAKEAQQ